MLFGLHASRWRKLNSYIDESESDSELRIEFVPGLLEVLLVESFAIYFRTSMNGARIRHGDQGCEPRILACECRLLAYVTVVFEYCGCLRVLHQTVYTKASIENYSPYVCLMTQQAFTSPQLRLPVLRSRAFCVAANAAEGRRDFTGKIDKLVRYLKHPLHLPAIA